MKRILVYGISGGFGGVEAVIYNVIRNADKKRVQFDILTYYSTVQYHEEYFEMGVNIYKITSKHENPLKNKKEMQDFFKEHAKEYDVVWCNLAELINIDILKIAKKYGIEKRIIHSHSVASTRGSLLTMLHKLNKKIIDRIATDFWACSELAGKWFFDDKIMHSEKFNVIKNAIDTEKYIFDEKIRRQIREELNVQDNFVVGHVGRFSIGEKNTLFLLEVFKEIVKKRPEAKLMLVGDGNDRKQVEEKIDELSIREQTLLLGYRANVNELMDAMDVFLLPSKMEGLGLVLIEAQACGLRCFTSNKVVPQEVKITDLVEFIDLTESPESWAVKIANTKREGLRYSRKEDVQNAGYDIKLETKRIVELLEN